MQWEYRYGNQDDKLNALGSEGWELCASRFSDLGAWHFIFKRPKEETAKEMFADITDVPGVLQKHEYKPLHKDEILMGSQPKECTCSQKPDQQYMSSVYKCPKHDA